MALRPLHSLLLLALPVLAGCGLAAPTALAADTPASPWKRGIEHQRQADLGDGTFLNPVFAGDRPDPSVLKDGDDYYLTSSSFDAYPGLPIWHSRDLVNWQPLGHAITTNVGSIWAPDIVKHNDRYYIYFPARTGGTEGSTRSNYVVWADDIRGPWSEPINLGLGKYIDPGHAVGEDGKRYLFLSGGDYVQLSDDGLSVVGEPRHVYDGWQYPQDWDVESYAQEGPKIHKRGDWYYMTTAVGGTAGPPTGHMVISARSKSIHGPWENSPHNPITRTVDRSEPWWSRVHATVVEGGRVAVGDALARALTARGFIVVHDTTAFEPPTLSTAYKRSLAMLRTRLDAGERYDYWLDVHRDAYSESYRGANSVETAGGSAARVMLLVGKGTGATGSGFDERPDWPKNLELAQAVTEAANALAPGICREVKIKRLDRAEKLKLISGKNTADLY